MNVGTIPTTTTITASKTASVVGQPVTFTVTLNSGAMPLFFEHVTVYHYLNGVRYTDVTAITNADGQFTLTQTFGSRGQRQYYATFAGDGAYSSSTSSVHAINVGSGAATTTTVFVNNPTPAVNQKVTFTATIKSGTASLTYKPVTIYHYLNGVRYTDTTKTANAAGQITLTQTFGSAGPRYYYATFAGDGSYCPSISSVLTITVH